MPARSDDTRTYGVEVASSPLPAVIRVLGTSPETSFRLLEGACVLGAGKGADLILKDETVSRRHIELTLVPEGVALTDLGSRNGTFYLGQRVERMILGLGSRIRLGRVEVAVEPDHVALAASVHAPSRAYANLLGGGPAMRQLFALLTRLEGSLATVLITGESGTGKEVVARALHEHSMVRDGPFIALNCGAMDRGLVRSELFGHARGAFTGAVEARGGAFEAASGGTLFLDEIGELPLEIQPVLLRALETNSVTRVGETKERSVKVRLIAATNRNLEQQLRLAQFREDLYYRLLVVRLELPSLAARREDIPALVRHFAAEHGITEVPPDVISEFEARDYPGNLRELRNAVGAYVALGTLHQGSPRRQDATLDTALRTSIDLDKPYAEQKELLLERFLGAYLELLMAHTGGNQSEAARLSGIERSHLNRLLRRRGKAEPD